MKNKQTNKTKQTEHKIQTSRGGKFEMRKKIQKGEKSNKNRTRRTSGKHKTRYKFKYISNYIKYKRIKCSN